MLHKNKHVDNSVIYIGKDLELNAVTLTDITEALAYGWTDDRIVKVNNIGEVPLGWLYDDIESAQQAQKKLRAMRENNIPRRDAIAMRTYFYQEGIRKLHGPQAKRILNQLLDSNPEAVRDALRPVIFYNIKKGA